MMKKGSEVDEQYLKGTNSGEGFKQNARNKWSNERKAQTGDYKQKADTGGGGGQTKLNNIGYETYEKGGHKQNAQTAGGNKHMNKILICSKQTWTEVHINI